jgi:outer membrane protein TolC
MKRPLPWIVVSAVLYCAIGSQAAGVSPREKSKSASDTAPTPFQSPKWSLSLQDAEAAVLQTNPSVTAAKWDRLSAEKNADAQETNLLPQIGADGYLKYVDKLATMSLLPGEPLVLGTHQNWSAGISASWTVWDWGALHSAWKSAGAVASQKSQAERLTRRQVLLAVRSAYLQVRLANEQVRLLADSLTLSQAQLKDVEARLAAGTAGQLDLSSARQETLARRRGLREARASLSGALRDLTDLTGLPPSADSSLPLDSFTAAKPPQGIDPPTLILEMEAEEGVRTRLTDKLPTLELSIGEAETQPQIQQWTDAAEAARRQASGAKASMLPKIQVSGRSSYDYPDQLAPVTVQQNTAMVSASMPIFDWGHSLKQAAAARDQAEAAEARKTQARADWERDLAKADDQYKALRDEAVLDLQSSVEADGFAKLVRDSYRAGRSTYLEVESADLKALQSKVDSARTNVQVLLQAAVLKSLTTD